MANSRQIVRQSHGPDTNNQSGQGQAGRKRSVSEAFEETDESPATLADQKRIYEEQDLQRLGDFADAVRTIINGCGKRYSSAEEKPRLPGFMPQTEEALKACQGITQTALTLIQKSGYQDKNTYVLRDAMANLKFGERIPTRRIGLDGDSGVGKTSLINSLLDTQHLAYAGADGSACTCVPTEYRQAWSGQEKTFQAEAHFFQWPEIEHILRYSIQHWFSWYKATNSLGKGCGSDQDLEEEAEAGPEPGESSTESEIQAKTAFTTFRELFAKRAEFSDEATAKDFLAKAVGCGELALLKEMMAWTRDLMRELGAPSLIVKMSAESEKEMVRKLQPFISSAKGEVESPRYWPIIKLVRIGLHAPVLDRGVILMDLPGTSDINLARARATARNQRECQFHLVVARLDRIETNKSLYHALGRSYSQVGSELALVCTFNEELGDNPDPRAFEASKEDTKNFNKLEQVIKGMNSQIEQIDTDIAELTDDGEMLMALGRKRRLESYSYALATLRQEFLVRLRNDKATRNSQQSYQTRTKNPNQLRVHSVSNKHYKAHLTGYKVRNMPCSLGAAGIPGVRLCVLTLPSRDRFESVWNYWKIDVPGVIAQIRCWCARSAMERQLDLREVVVRELEQLDVKVTDFALQLNKQLESIILNPMRQNEVDWKQEALDAADRWSGLYWSKYSARIRRSGNVPAQTNDGIDRSWNAELQEPLEEGMRRCWKNLEDVAEEVNVQSLADMCRQLDSVRESVQEFPNAKPEAVDSLTAVLQNEKRRLEKWSKQTRQTLQNAIRDLSYRCTTEDDQASIFAEAMEVIYESCRTIKGAPRHKAQKVRMHDAIATGEIYQDFATRFQESFMNSVDELRGRLDRGVKGLKANVLQSFDHTFFVEEQANPLRDKLSKDLLDFTEEALLKLSGPIRAQLRDALLCASDAPSQDTETYLEEIDNIHF